MATESEDVRSSQLRKGALWFAKEARLHPIINGKSLIGLKQGDEMSLYLCCGRITLREDLG
jgi:hypothetical protein